MARGEDSTHNDSDARAELALARWALRFPLHRYLGIEVVQLRPHVVAKMRISDAHSTLGGRLHGGAMATIVDVAGNLAASLSPTFDWSTCALKTLDLRVRFVAQPKGDVVRASAVRVADNPRIIRVDCRLVDNTGRQIAVADITSIITKNSLVTSGPTRQHNGTAYSGYANAVRGVPSVSGGSAELPD